MSLYRSWAPWTTLSSSARNPNDTQILCTARFSPQRDSQKSWSEKSWTKQAVFLPSPDHMPSDPANATRDMSYSLTRNIQVSRTRNDFWQPKKPDSARPSRRHEPTQQTIKHRSNTSCAKQLTTSPDVWTYYLSQKKARTLPPTFYIWTSSCSMTSAQCSQTTGVFAFETNF
jgi:hypothetical protein